MRSLSVQINVILTLQQAIGRQEGYSRPGTRATMNNNPGNIIWGEFSRTHGATGGDDAGYAVFPNQPAGFAALTALLTDPNYVHDTVGQAINSYLGHPSTNPLSKGNNASLYIQDVCEWCDAAPTTPIADLLG